MILKTAYGEKKSLKYDETRFSTPQGLAFERREMEQLVRFLRCIPAKGKVLEVGCGTGRFCDYLAAKGFTVEGLDPSPHMVELASRRCREHPNVSIRQGEGTHTQSESDKFDFVFAIRVTNLTESRDYAMAMIREMIRVAKPGGHILVEYLNSWRPRLSKDVFLSQRMIARMLDDNRTPAHIGARSGILILSHRAFSKCPAFLLPAVVALDRTLSWLLPRFTDRSYVLIKKND